MDDDFTSALYKNQFTLRTFSTDNLLEPNLLIEEQQNKTLNHP